MSTKVKGEAIKDGSIPLSALAEDVKGNFNGKYGLNDYLGQLTDTNPLFIEGPRTFIYMLANNKIYRFGQSVYKVTLSGNGPSITITGSQTSKGWTFTASGNTVALYEVKFYANKVDVETPTPNWNAQEGEAGYIDNKPFYTRIIDTITPTSELEVVQVPTEVTNWNGVWKFDIDKVWYPSLEYSLEIIANSYNGYVVDSINNVYSDDDDTFIGTKIEFHELENGWSYKYFVAPESKVVELHCYGDTQFIPDCINIVYYEKINDKYLSDTVIKTTPQTLTDTDKNQALANLGIPKFITLDMDAFDSLYLNTKSIEELNHMLGGIVLQEIPILGIKAHNYNDSIIKYIYTSHQTYNDFGNGLILNKLILGNYSYVPDLFENRDLEVNPIIFIEYNEDKGAYDCYRGEI